MSDIRRYRLIPARGQGTSWVIEGELNGAVTSAHKFFTEHGIPVVICEAPVGGIVRRIQQVGKGATTTRRKAA